MEVYQSNKFVYDLFVLDFPDLESLMYPDQDSFGGSINPKTSYELNCKGFPYNSLNLIAKQISQGISCDIFEIHFQPEHVRIDMIHMPHVHSKFSLLLQSWVIIHQFSIFWSFVSLERFLCLSDACQFYYKHFTCKYFGMRSMYLPPFSKRHETFSWNMKVFQQPTENMEAVNWK